MLFTNYYDSHWGITSCIVPVVCACCYSLALFLKKEKTAAQMFLAIFMLGLGIGRVFCFTYDWYFITDKAETLRTVTLSCMMIEEVLMLFYFTALINPGRIKKKYLVSYVAMAWGFMLLLMTADKILGNPSFDIWHVFKNMNNPSVIAGLAGGACVILFGCGVISMVMYDYINYRRHILQNYSHEGPLILWRFASTIACFAALSLTALLAILYQSVPLKILFNITSILSMTGIFAFGFQQKSLPAMGEVALPEELPREDDHEKGVKLSLRQRRQLQMEQKLKAYFEEQKPYLNAEISLSDVAGVMGINTTYLSRFIHEQLHTNFYTYVNDYRINHSLSLIEKQKGDITSDILYTESGFRSRSTFYELFKKQTGLSPQRYIREMAFPVDSGGQYNTIQYEF